MKSILFALLTFTLAVRQLAAQPADDNFNRDRDTNDVSYAPLLLYTNGTGFILPFRDGEMLEVGRRYAMIAIPDRGYAFTNWDPVNVFTFTETVLDANGNPSTTTNTLLSPVPGTNRCPVQEFTMQPVQVILDEPGVRTITESQGWEANFVVENRRVGRQHGVFPAEDGDK